MRNLETPDFLEGWLLKTSEKLFTISAPKFASWNCTESHVVALCEGKQRTLVHSCREYLTSREKRRKRELSYLQVAIYYFVYYINDTNYEVFSIFRRFSKILRIRLYERFRLFSEIFRSLPKTSKAFRGRS